MSAAEVRNFPTDPFADLTRREYVDRQSRKDAANLGLIFLVVWLGDLAPGMMSSLVAAYGVILLMARFDHGRKWDRLQPSRRTSAQPDRQPGA